LEFARKDFQATSLQSIKDYDSMHFLFMAGKFPKSPIEGVVSDVRVISSGDTEVILKTAEDSGWSISFGHLLSTSLQKGDSISKAQTIGLPKEGEMVSFAVYRDYDHYAICPLMAFDVFEQNNFANLIHSFMSEYEQRYQRTDFYNETLEVSNSNLKLYGCLDHNFSFL
jgi:hypothetical protein